MIEARTLELIHADLDGELDADARAELQRRLDADPQARAQHGQLLKMAGALGRMAPETPPAELEQQILQALRPAAKVLPFRERRVQFVRYAMALAAGMIIAAVGIGFAGGSRTAFDPNELVGTMGGPASAPPIAASVVKLQAPELGGSVGLSQAGGRWLLVFDLDSEQPVKVTAAYSDAAFRLNGYAQGDSGVGEFRSSPGRVEFVNQGSQRLALFLEPGAGGPVRISFEGQGRVLQEAVLDVPRQEQAR
jgi:hypothetical protein